MAEEETIPSSIETAIDNSIDAPSKPKRSRRRQPSYQIVGESKIPVSKATGAVWKSRKGMAVKAMGDLPTAWDEAIEYYTNDQLGHRVIREDKGGSENLVGAQHLSDDWSETENIVFSNVSTMVPALYSRNPRVEITANNEAEKPFAVTLERLVNTIAGRKGHPGINLKPKAKRCVVTSLLTNRSWIQIGWVFKAESSEEALRDLEKLAAQLEKAKDNKKIEEIEGKITALESTVDILEPSGPTAKYRGPNRVLIDPNAEEVDLTDANWIMTWDFLPTEFLLARFAKKNKKSGQQTSIFEPTHVMKLSKEKDSAHEEITNFQLFTEDAKGETFGFEDEDAFRKAKYTKVWFVWDKVTRRVLMYNDNDWTWPIWVWDDPLRLDRFYPFYPLTFYESPVGVNSKGEVTYYLDQQDAINEINSEERVSRRWARRNVFFDSNRVDRADVEMILNGPDGTARGVNLPEGMKLQDVIDTIVPPSLKYKELFDKQPKLEAIDRISSVGAVMRGEQFKTNTTNDAVQANVGASNIRTDEKADQIEDWIGEVLWGIAQLCLQHMTPEQVAELIDVIKGEGEWKNMTPEEIKSTLSMTVVGGSTKKPTSKAKKEEALELGQVLGQFVNAAPGPVLKIMLKAMQEAFDEVVIRDEDWEEIEQAIAGQQQAGPGGTGGAQGNATAGAPQQNVQGAPAPVGANGGQPQDIEQLLASIPPELKGQIVELIRSGVPAEQAIQQVTQQKG